LSERAQALAKPLEEARTPTEMLELLVFSLAGERYGIEATRVLEVVPLRGLTPMPCTPSFVLGVVNHRGRVVPVLDVRRLLDLPGEGVAEGWRMVVVEAGGMTFGIIAEAVIEISRVGAEEVAPSPASFTARRQAFVRGVTKEMVAVLEVEALARDPRITVNEEAG
jgi:purine-binding chemotaxis protein CheW